ncbi:MAG TPA: class I SAM-dependent methyltransferase [Terriglobales bacterium]|nr:class I SAM-dependent methyltransferase [Terriglobales bacterium]
MGLYSRFVFPHIMERLSAGPRVDEQRRLALAPACGEVLELGFGTGHNFPHYPKTVTHVTAVDCQLMMPAKVKRRIDNASVSITPMYRDASKGLPFADGSFDTVVTTWTLCSIRDVIPALTEIGRVLKRSGHYLFLEHGRSDNPRIAMRQRLLSPVVHMIGAGCQMDRPIDALMDQVGLRIRTLDRFVMPEAPRVLGEMYRGTATAGIHQKERR